MPFRLLSKLGQIETIASGASIREIARLRKIYGPLEEAQRYRKGAAF